MKRSNFLKGLFALPFAVKAVTKEEALPKDKDGFYITKKEFEKEVREREVNNSFSGITMSVPSQSHHYVTSSAMIGTCYSGITGSIHIDDIKNFNERISGYHNSKL